MEKLTKKERDALLDLSRRLPIVNSSNYKVVTKIFLDAIRKSTAIYEQTYKDMHR